MNKIFTICAFSTLLLTGKLEAQTFSPITTTGYNWDAVAEATSASLTTTGAIDGSNYILYSAAYGALFSATGGLANNGLISSGTRTYQLQPYTQNNMLFVPNGVTDSLTFSTPASYAGLSLLCFSTEGNGTVNVTVRFTDNSTQVFSNQSLTDWFGTGTSITSGFDRANRTSGTPSNASGNPKMFAMDLAINCANRAKLVKNIKIQNTGTNPRDCFMAVSGAAMPTYTVATTPVSCAGGTNGSATVTPAGGIQPFTYTWSTTPAQSSSVAANLSVGVYSYTVQDGGLCPVTFTTAITQSLQPQPALNVAANLSTICAGAAVSMTTSGASTYTWNTLANTTTLSVNPAVTTTYSVGGLTTANCFLTGSITIVVNPLPVLNFTTPAAICVNAPQLPLSATPSGGSYTGNGVTFGIFYPNFAGVGTKTVSYTYTDANSCTSVAVNTIFVNAIPTINFTVSANSLCINTPTLTLTATPVGGTFTGTGVSGSAYSPSVAGLGTQTVSYAFTDANNCTATSVSTVVINGLPTVAFQTTKKLFCIFTPSLFLNASPSGGTFSGSGVSASGAFSPASAGVGNHNIVYSYTDGNNCTASAVLATTVSACTGINETISMNDAAYTIYPNPSNGTFSIRASGDMELNIINELGQVLQTVALNESNAHETSVSNLPTGIYFISGQANGQMIRQKLIITK